MHISFIVCLRYTPHQVPGRGGARHPPPRGVTHRFTPVRSNRRITTTTFRVRSSLLAATGPSNSRDGGGGGYGCGLEVDTAAVDALGGGWARLEVPAGRSEGQREGRRGRQNVRMRLKRAGFEAPGLLRTFVGGPATAQWAVAGEAPPSSMTALGRAHSVGTAESGCHLRPHIGTGDRYTSSSQAGWPRQARAFRGRSRG